MDMNLSAGGSESTSSMRHWKARLSLDFQHLDGRTRLSHCAHEGPLRIQRLFHPDRDGRAHCYLLHPPGGVVLGDELLINAHVRSGQALLTTPSAGRFYSVDGQPLRQHQSVKLSVETGRLEWLPQETILFDGADARLRTELDLQDDGQLAFWDVLVLGRPASGERFTRGGLEQSLRIRRNESLLFSERLAFRAGDRVHRSPMGLHDASTLGIAIFTAHPDEALLRRWSKASNDRDPQGSHIITQRGELLIARYRGEDAQRCRAAFTDLWRIISEDRDGHEPAIPRIWHT